MNDSNSPLRPIISLPPPLSGGFFLSSFFRNRGGLFPPCFTPGIPSFAIQLAKGQKINWGHDCKNSTLFNQPLLVFFLRHFFSLQAFFHSLFLYSPTPKKSLPKMVKKEKKYLLGVNHLFFFFFFGEKGEPAGETLHEKYDIYQFPNKKLFRFQNTMIMHIVAV